jgi:hypothetical protein
MSKNKVVPPPPGFDPAGEAARYGKHVRQWIRRKHGSMRAIENGLEWEAGRLARTLDGDEPLTVKDLLRILKVLEVEPRRFVEGLYGTEALAQNYFASRGLLRSVFDDKDRDHQGEPQDEK